MKLKANYFSTIIAVIFRLIISSLPATIVLILINLKSEYFEDIKFMTIVYYAVFMAIAVLMIVLNTIISIFSKTYILIETDYMEYKKRKFYFNEVKIIEFDVGHISKSTYEPNILTITYKYGEDINIKNVPFILLIILKKKCKTTLIRYFKKSDLGILTFIMSLLQIAFVFLIKHGG